MCKFSLKSKQVSSSSANLFDSVDNISIINGNKCIGLNNFIILNELSKQEDHSNEDQIILIQISLAFYKYTLSCCLLLSIAKLFIDFFFG